MTLRSAAAALLAVALAACDTRVVGTYDAVMVSGHPLPYHHVDGSGEEFAILSGTLTFWRDNRWRAAFLRRFTSPGEVRVDTAFSYGSWAADDRFIYLRGRKAPLGNPVIHATLRDDTLRWEWEGLAAIFTRQP